MTTSNYQRMVEDVLMILVNRDIACYDEIKDTSKKDLCEMLDEVAEAVDYYNFAMENKVFIR